MYDDCWVRMFVFIVELFNVFIVKIEMYWGSWSVDFSLYLLCIGYDMVCDYLIIVVSVDICIWYLFRYVLLFVWIIDICLISIVKLLW